MVSRQENVPSFSTALAGLKVLDVATLFAGPQIAMTLGDFGADVIKVEHPKGDPMRTLGAQKDGIGLWWKIVNRNKRNIAVDLHNRKGIDILLKLVDQADVLIENFRPGTLASFGAPWELLHSRNPGLIVLRVSGFGQYGPYSNRAGYGTLAEAFSGVSYITGAMDGPPTLAPFGLADGVAALAGTYAVMIALWARQQQGQSGQEIDLSLYEPLFSLTGSMPAVYQQLGIIQERRGNRSVNNAPRNTYQTKDEQWIAISTAAPSTYRRLMRLVGRPDLADDPALEAGGERVKRVDELDAAITRYTSSHTMEEVIRECEAVGAAVAPVYNIAQIVSDRHYQHRQSYVEVDDVDLGKLGMANVLPKLGQTPGSIRWTGRGVGADTETILKGELGLDTEDIEQLVSEGAIGVEKSL